MLRQLNATEIWIKLSQSGLFMSVIRLIYLMYYKQDCKYVPTINWCWQDIWCLLWNGLRVLWHGFQLSWKWIIITVHIYVRLVEAHSLIKLPCFLLFPKACPFRSGLFTTTTTSSPTRFARVQDLYGSLRFLQAAMTVLTDKKWSELKISFMTEPDNRKWNDTQVRRFKYHLNPWL